MTGKTDSLDPLAQIWIEGRLERLRVAQFRALAKDLEKAQREAAPLIAKHNAERIARMRQDGPFWFVMVEK